MTDAGVVRRYPEADPRCSEDNSITAWVLYADGRIDYETKYVDADGYSGFFRDAFGTLLPHPFDAGRAIDGSLDCQFIDL